MSGLIEKVNDSETIFMGENLIYDEETDHSYRTNWDERDRTFESMGLKEDLLRGITSNCGFQQPSIIQEVTSTSINFYLLDSFDYDYFI